MTPQRALMFYAVFDDHRRCYLADDGAWVARPDQARRFDTRPAARRAARRCGDKNLAVLAIGLPRPHGLKDDEMDNHDDTNHETPTDSGTSSSMGADEINRQHMALQVVANGGFAAVTTMLLTRLRGLAPANQFDDDARLEAEQDISAMLDSLMAGLGLLRRRCKIRWTSRIELQPHHFDGLGGLVAVWRLGEGVLVDQDAMARLGDLPQVWQQISSGMGYNTLEELERQISPLHELIWAWCWNYVPMGANNVATMAKWKLGQVLVEILARWVTRSLLNLDDGHVAMLSGPLTTDASGRQVVSGILGEQSTDLFVELSRLRNLGGHPVAESVSAIYRLFEQGVFAVCRGPAGMPEAMSFYHLLEDVFIKFKEHRFPACRVAVECEGRWTGKSVPVPWLSHSQAEAFRQAVAAPGLVKADPELALIHGDLAWSRFDVERQRQRAANARLMSPASQDIAAIRAKLEAGVDASEVSSMIMSRAAAVREVRQRTGAGIRVCKEALVACDGDITRAVEHLQRQGHVGVERLATRATGAGWIFSYVHQGRVGAMVEIHCETDFVARSEPFQQLGHDIAMHIAAAAPAYLGVADIPEAVTENERELVRRRALEQGLSEEQADAQVRQHLVGWWHQVCLLEQFWIRDGSKTIAGLVADLMGRVGENVLIRRFLRFEVGA
jgi:elongation factor Ts